MMWRWDIAATSPSIPGQPSASLPRPCPQRLKDIRGRALDHCMVGGQHLRDMAQMCGSGQGRQCRAENPILTSPVGHCSEPASGMALNAQDGLCFPNLVLSSLVTTLLR